MSAEEIISGVDICAIDDIAKFAYDQAFEIDREYWNNVNINQTISGVHASNDFKKAYEIELLLSKRLLRLAIINHYSTKYPQIDTETLDFVRCLDSVDSAFKLQKDIPTNPFISLPEMFISSNIEHSCYQAYHHIYDDVLVVGINHRLTSSFDITKLDVIDTFGFELLLDRQNELKKFICNQTQELVNRRFKSFASSMSQINEYITSGSNPTDYYTDHESIFQEFSHYYDYHFNHENNIDRYVVPMLKFKNYQEAIKCVEWLDKICDYNNKRDNLHKFWILNNSREVSLNNIILETMRVHWRTQ